MDTYPEKQEMLDTFEQNLREGEIRIDKTLARLFLRDEHPECEEALVAALEQSRLPIRQALIKKAGDALDEHWRKFEEWKAEYSKILEEMVVLMGEYGESLPAKWEALLKELTALDHQDLSEEERKQKAEEIFRRAEEKQEALVCQIEERSAVLQTKLHEVMGQPAKAEQDHAAIMATLAAPYVAECEKKSRAIYVEFLT